MEVRERIEAAIHRMEARGHGHLTDRLRAAIEAIDTGKPVKAVDVTEEVIAEAGGLIPMINMGSRGRVRLRQSSKDKESLQAAFDEFNRVRKI